MNDARKKYHVESPYLANAYTLLQNGKTLTHFNKPLETYHPWSQIPDSNLAEYFFILFLYVGIKDCIRRCITVMYLTY